MSTAASKEVTWSVIRPPAQRVLLWLLPCFFSVTAEMVADMCGSIADDLGASGCTEVLNEHGKGFRLVGTLEHPLRFNDIGFDDNMVGLSAGSQNVCLLAAFGNGGVVLPNCVPIIGTQADEFNGSPEQHYFGMEGFDCGYNFMAFTEGSTISWSFPLGNSCISDADLDLGLTSLYCHFQLSCELGTTTTSTRQTTITSTSTFVTSTVSTLTSTATKTYTYTSATSTEVTRSPTTVVTAESTMITTPEPTTPEPTVPIATTEAVVESTTLSSTVLSSTATPMTTEAETTATPAAVSTTEAETSTAQDSTVPVTQTTLEPSTSVSITSSGNSSCDNLPRIRNSQSLAHCLGLASGSFCPVTCLEGYATSEDILFCNDGAWQIRGECIQQGVDVTTESAAQIVLRMNLTIEESDQSSLEWAEQNQEALHLAFASSLGAHPSEIRVDLLPTGMGRRLAQNLAFDVRITWLLGAANATNKSSDVAVQELALLANAEGMSRFEEALQTELNGTESVLAGVAVEALSTEVIDSYVVPAASWILGPWDSSACNCAGDATEVAQVSCSLGSWLLCSGLEPPITERPCRQCAEQSSLAIPSWILPTALCVGFCCCGILGACLARHFLPHWLSRIMQWWQSASGHENLCPDHKADGLPVDSVKSASDPDDTAVIKRLSTIRPTLTRETSQSRHLGVGFEEEDVQPTRTRVIWDLDLKKISSYFSSKAKKYSSHVAPESRKASKAPCGPGASPCCVASEIDEADLENPVAMEPSWVSAGEVRMPVPVLSPSQRSLRSQHSKGTLLNAPCGTPVNKADTERTLKRTIL